MEPSTSMRLTSSLARTLAIVLLATLGVALQPSAAAADDASDEAAFLQLLNGERSRSGLGALAFDAVAADNVARPWSVHMAGTGSLAHNPNLATEVSHEVTPEWTRLGENVGRGGDVSALHSAFMSSSGHRANILGDYNRVGIGVARDRAGSIWVTFVFIKGPAISVTAPAPTPPSGGDTVGRGAGIATWPNGRLDVVVRGGDGAVWARTNTGSSWTGWYSLGGYVTSDPDAVSWSDNRIDIVGTGGDGAVWHRAWTGSGWSPWTSLGGGFTSGPTIASAGSGKLIVLGRGLDGALWARTFANGAWSGWTSLGGGFTSDPDATSPSAGRLAVVGRGLDDAVWVRHFDGNGWGGWTSLGGRVTSAPTITSPSSGRLDVFARGSDNATWSRTATTGSNWSGWSSLGGAIVSAPEAGGANGRLTLVGRGGDDALWARTLGAGGWSAWYTLR